MENNATYDYESIDKVLFYIYNYFGYEDIKDIDVYSAAQIVLPMIGNTHQETYHYIGKPDNFGTLKIPCNIEKIESVTIGFTDFRQDLKNATEYYPIVLDGIEVYNYLDQTKSNLHSPGTYVNYKYTGRSIEVDPKYKDQDIYVIYKGFIADEQGNPKITSREAIAVAYYYNFLRQQKAAFNGTGDGNLLTMSKQDALEKISNARVPLSISQNQWDQLKKSHTSGNRWKYNTPYKYTL